jgi:hypothetical protein
MYGILWAEPQIEYLVFVSWITAYSYFRMFYIWTGRFMSARALIFAINPLLFFIIRYPV